MAYRKGSTSDYKPTGQFVKWDEVGKVVEGKWVRAQTKVWKDKEKDEAVFLDGEGEEKVFPLTAALLTYFEAVFGGARNVPEGAEFRITFTGYQPIKGQPQPMKIFDVEFDDSVIPADEPGF